MDLKALYYTHTDDAYFVMRVQIQRRKGTLRLIIMLMTL